MSGVKVDYYNLPRDLAFLHGFVAAALQHYHYKAFSNPPTPQKKLRDQHHYFVLRLDLRLVFEHGTDSRLSLGLQQMSLWHPKFLANLTKFYP